MKGNGKLCRVLVNANACLGSENNERITMFNYQVNTTQKFECIFTNIKKVDENVLIILLPYFLGH